MSSTIVEKPWGYEKIWARTGSYVGKLLHINRGHRLSEQYHRIKDETIYVLEGILHLELDGGKQTLFLSKGESYRITPGTVHRFAAPDHLSVELMEVSTPELEDVVRTADDYDRVD